MNVDKIPPGQTPSANQPLDPDKIAPQHELSPDERAGLYDRLLWCLLRGCGIKLSLREAQLRALSPRPGKRQWHLLPKEAKATSGAALTLAKDLYDAEDARIKQVDDKAKALLSATSILFTLSGAVIALTANRDTSFRWLVAIALFLLLVTLFLLVGGYFGLNRFAQPVLNLTTAAQLEAGNQNELVRDYQNSAWLDSQVLEFLVAAYRAARRAFQAAMLILAIAGLTALFSDHPNDAIIRQLRADAQFIDQLRGPKGDPGPSGAPGPAGPAGPPGAAASMSSPPTTPTRSPTAVHTPKRVHGKRRL